MSSNPLLYPNIGGAPGGVPLIKDPQQAPEPRGIPSGSPATQQADFDKLLREGMGAEKQKDVERKTNLATPGLPGSAKAPLKFSAHASARIQSRSIDTGPDQMRRINDAVDKAAAKGLDDTLILTNDAAFIVSVKNRTVITVMDREQLQGNVFTNIDGAVIA